VTQFRYVAVFTALTALATKYTVPSVAGSSTGYIDFSELAKTIILLGRYQWGTTTDLTKMTVPKPQSEYVTRGFSVQVKEQYYLSGVFTENTGSTLAFVIARGWTDSATKIHLYKNWNQINGLSNFMPYSGHAKIVYPVRTEDPSWNNINVYNFMNIKLTFQKKDGSTLSSVNNWFDRDVTGWSRAVYFPLYRSGSSDHKDFGRVMVQIYTSTTASGGTLEETFYIDKNVETCADDELVVMFRDRLNQWSFMSFSKKSFTTINTDPQMAETGLGRYRYNVDSSDTITGNTDWMDDEQNELVKDLMATELSYIVESDGALTPVTVVPNSLRLQTSRMDGLHQYQIAFRKSFDNFAP
jgi:hypothetical protein